MTERGISVPMVSIVIPTYNRKNDVLECLGSLKKLDYPNYEIIVVDNNSTDGTSEAIEQDFPDVKILQSRSNLGVTGGRNLGARHAKGDFVLFLDNDMIVEENCVTELVKAMQTDQRIGAVGPIIYYYDDPERVWAAGTSISLVTGKVSFNLSKSINKGQFTDAMSVEVLPAIALVRKSLLKSVGLFDDTFFAVYEDTDFCFRIREAGYRLLCISATRAWHKVSSDERKSIEGVMNRAYLVSRNRIIFMKKHSKNFPAFVVLFLPIYLIYYTLYVFCLNRVGWSKSFLKGAVSGIALTLKSRDSPLLKG